MTVAPYLRLVAAQGRDTLEVGPFVAHFNPDAASEGSNYAIPVDGAAPTRGDVAALVRAFEERGRRPRLEFLPATAPAVEPALLAVGFEVQLRTVVMTRAAAPATVPDPAVVLETLDGGASEAALRAFVELQRRAFGDPPDAGRVAWLRRALGRWILVLARVDGAPAGAGMALDVRDATTELVGIATAEPLRGRGVALAVTVELTRLARARGAETVFLTPGDPGAGRVYRRAGFREAGAMVHLRAA